MTPTDVEGGLPPLVGPPTPPGKRLAGQSPDAWSPRKPTASRAPASTPGLRSGTYRMDLRAAGQAVLRGELRHATSTMGLTPSALQRLGAAGEAQQAAEPGDGGAVGDSSYRRRPTVPARCSGACGSHTVPRSHRVGGAGGSRASSREGAAAGREGAGRSPPEFRRGDHRPSPVHTRGTPSPEEEPGRERSPRVSPEAVRQEEAQKAATPAAASTNASPKPRVPVDVNTAFSIGHMLGSGAFGTVWMAQNRTTGDRVAIKILEKKRQLQEDFRLEPAEVEILKTVHHANIVALRDVFSSENCVYLVMELVMGGHLQARLKDRGCYDEPSARMLLAQVRKDAPAARRAEGGGWRVEGGLLAPCADPGVCAARSAGDRGGALFARAEHHPP